MILVSASGADISPAPVAGGDIDLWLGLKEPAYMAPVTISADGKWIAVMMKGQVSEGNGGNAGLSKEAGIFEAASEDLAGSEVFIVERATGKVIHPFCEYAASYSPVWSPSGDTLLLAVQDSPARLSRIATWSPGDSAPHVFAGATFQPDIGFSAPAWTPDARKIVFPLYNVTPEKRPRIVEKVVPATDDTREPSAETPKTTLAVLNLESGEVRAFSGLGPYGYSHVWGFRLAPNGKSAAFLGRATPDRQAEDVNWVKLTTVNLETGAVQIIGDTPQTEDWSMSFSWSPDCRHIAWVPTVGKKYRLLIATLGDKPALRDVPLPKDVDAGWLYPEDDWPPAPPLWTADSSSFWLPGKNALLHFSADGSSLGTLPLPPGMGGSDWLECAAPSFAPVRTQAVPASGVIHLLRKREIETVNLQASPSPKVASLPGIAGKERAIDWATSMLFGLRRSGFRGWDLMQSSFADGKTSRLAVLQPALTGIDLGTTRTLSWKVPGGEVCKGTLLLPLGWKEGDKPPVVMDVYGDDKGSGGKTPEEMTDVNLIINTHLLGAHGYAVFKPDMPQSKSEPAASLVRSAEAAVDALAASGLVDIGRIAITGQSYGGYTALCVLVASNKFKAGIVANGIYDLTRADTESSGSVQWAEEGQGLMDASLWEKTQRYIDNSPLFALNKLQTPLLVLQGESDTISNTQGPALQVALTRLGKPSTYLLAPGMDHVPVSWSVETQRELIPRILAFLDKYLKKSP